MQRKRPPNDGSSVLPGCVKQTDETDQGLATELCFHGVEQNGLSRIQTFQSDVIKYEITDSVSRDHGCYSREVKGQWNYENIVYHRVDLPPPGQETGDPIRYLMAGQTGVLCDKVEIPHVSDHPRGVGQDGNYGYEGHGVHPIQQHPSSDYPENPVSVRPCYADQGVADLYYENQTQNNLRWIADPEKRENPYLYTENFDPIPDRSFDRGFRASLYEVANGADWDCESLHWRPEPQDSNSMDATLDLSMKNLPTSQFSSGQSVIPENQIQYPNHFGNFSASARATNYYADPKIETHDGRLGAHHWDPRNCTLDLSMKRRAMNQFTSGYNTVMDNQTQYGNNFENFSGFTGITYADMEPRDLRIGTENLNSMDTTLDLSINRQAANQCTSGYSTVMDNQTQYGNNFGNFQGFTGTTAAEMEPRDLRIGAEDLNSMDITLDLSTRTQATNQFTRGLDVMLDDQFQNTDGFLSILGLHRMANCSEPNMETVDWRHLDEDWNSLDIPLDLSAEPATYPVVSDQSESPVVHCSYSLESVLGSSGTANLEIASQASSSPGIVKDRPIKRRRKRRGTLAPIDDAPPAPPLTESEQRQQLRENELLASYRPILPKPSAVKSSKMRRVDEEDPTEMRKRWHGWKCCSETFDDYNLYKHHVETTHEDPALTATQKSSKKPAPTKKTVPSKSKTVICPLCSTNHDALGSDIITSESPDWSGSDCPMCPLCNQVYDNLRQLKIHFCTHFQVNVINGVEKPLCCRYCDKGFTRDFRLREHEAVCKTDCAARQSSEEEEEEETQPTEDVFRSAASRKISSRKTASQAAKAAAAATVPAAATRPWRPSVRRSMVASSATASEATKSAHSSASATASAQTSSAARTKSKKPDERLFYCPECGKLYTWEASVRRHMQLAHGNDPKKVGIPRLSAEGQKNLETQSHSQTPAPTAAEPPFVVLSIPSEQSIQA